MQDYIMKSSGFHEVLWDVMFHPNIPAAFKANWIQFFWLTHPKIRYHMWLKGQLKLVPWKYSLTIIFDKPINWWNRHFITEKIGIQWHSNWYHQMLFFLLLHEDRVCVMSCELLDFEVYWWEWLQQQITKTWLDL